MDRDSLSGCCTVCVVAILTLFLVLVIADWVSSSTIDATAQVLERTHVAAYTSWHWHTTYDGKQSHTHLSPTFHPEQWIVVISKDGKAISADATSSTYPHAEVGHSVPIRQRIGGLSGSVLSTWIQ